MKPSLSFSFPFVGSRFSSVAIALWLSVAGAGTAARGALPPEKLAQLPPASTAKVDFVRDIQPIFEASCVQCHGRGKAKGAFSLETREDFMEGGDTGAPAKAGKSAESLIIEMVSGLDPETVMPKKGKKLTPQQVSLFRAWVDQGMIWPKEVTFFKHEPANLRAKDIAQLAVPAKSKFTNPVDGFIDASFAKSSNVWPKGVDDRTYARRVWLDTVGLLPPPAELEAFLADPSPNKRGTLVQRLLSDNQRYAEHWLTFWNDLLRNDYKGAGYTDGGRKPVTGWLYEALARNVPYDRFVAQLIDPNADAEGFANGITWRGTVNASMVPPMQAAQSVAQVFLGVNLKCASCHDSFINEYTLKDSYGLASIYANGPLEIAECDKPTGHISQVKFLYSELGLIDAKADPAARKRQLADLITGRVNGRLPRTIVNRLWQRFMGYGLVEPVDEMDKPAWSPELMDWLAEDLAAHRYDLKHTIAQILTSRAYALPAVNIRETEEHFAFRGPGIRRLDAEQFSDALRTLTGLTYAKADAKLNRAVALQAAPAALPLSPKWIWSTPGAEVKAKPASLIFRHTINLSTMPTEAVLTIAADNGYTITVNSKAAGASSKRTSTGTDFYDIKASLKQGENIIAITGVNLAPDGVSPLPTAASVGSGAAEAGTQLAFPHEADNPAGLIVYARLRAGDQVMDFVTDQTWTVVQNKKELGHAVELGGVDLAPWRLGQHFLDVAAAPKDTLSVQRAALVFADPMMVALGRPNREQIVTVRQATATTLQALELTNGTTLAALLKRGADKLLTDAPPNSTALVTSLYQQALSRPPTAAEQTLAAELVGTPAKSEGVQDLLWALAMLPEFQLIR